MKCQYAVHNTEKNHIFDKFSKSLSILRLNMDELLKRKVTNTKGSQNYVCRQISKRILTFQ
jgi:hypothetical protein